MGPLDGLRVVDMTTVLMGPYATQILGDYGADIIKVEAPEGDVIRQIGPARHDGMGPVFMNSNRSKRSITLDLKTPGGRDALLRLCTQADVLIFNVRLKAMERLGLLYEDVAAVNPRIIYVGLYGYDQAGPYAARPAYDDLIQGASTLSYLFTRVNHGEPGYVPAAISDRIVGLSAINAILASVVERSRTGEGQRVDIPMFETMVSLLMSDHLGGLTFDPPLDNGGYARLLSHNRRPHKTSDGHICALVYTDAHWQRFFKAIGQPHMAQTNPSFATFVSRIKHIDEVYGWLSEVFLTRSTGEWLALLEEADVPAMPMHDFRSILDDTHLVSTGFFERVDHPSEGAIRSMSVPARWSRTPASPVLLAPRQGQHTIEILKEAGFSDSEVNALIADGAAMDER
ncbi:CoA transferase [Brucella sp. BE17]|uniref:CaiB/BaiF CoA transferase family protein n=1 Tax=Brucella sp. BE17 TaxID=3142977 RepID=UPI0031BA7FDA